MASSVLLAIAMVVLYDTFLARAQDTRTDRAGSVLREYVDKGYCTYTYVVPPGSRTGGCSSPGLETQLAETKEETGHLRNQVDHLSSMVETLLSRVNSLSAELSQERSTSAQLKQNLTQEIQEQENSIQARLQNLTTTLSEQQVAINQALQCACEGLVPGDTVSSPTAGPPPDPVPTAEVTTVEVASPSEPQPIARLQIHLADGRSPLEGRVEVRNGTGQWGSVCDDNFDLQDAYVVCRQLGFGAALEVKLAGHFGEGSGNVWLDEVACRGNETNLGDCSAESWGRSDCSHKEDVGVVCEGDGSMRLFGGLAPWEGRLEFRPWLAAEWGTVCHTGWTQAESELVCKQLGYTGGVNASLAAFWEGTGRVWLGDVTCSGDETNILSCGFSWEPSDCEHGQDIAVVCTGVVSVRLNGSQSSSEGLLEIRPGDGDWGTICDDGFDDRDAQVVCRQLGYRGGVAAVGGVFPQGTGLIWLDNLGCLGNESSVARCQINKWGDHDCTHKEDAGVICVLEDDCAEYRSSGWTTSGVFRIGLLPSDVEAFCDMNTADGGWTVIQRRQDGSVPFNRTWEEYKLGFGNKNGEYWLGNENIYILTNQKNYALRVDLVDWSGDSRYAEYSSFRLSSEADQYRPQISGYSGTAGDSMSIYINGQGFSTVDRDNDDCGCDCSQQHGQAGWWFTGCGLSFLNGHYLGNCGNSCPQRQGVVWYHWRGFTYSLKSVSMKIRP
ncbi:uncharacterized protein LOC118417855 [Branchiostoma floridae]|uniref:Soluble scavenger receptor cysteine-rich domain-containing protein SSC5D n=1 Tax=Branchiostoma floridae TaxID=7739 RepID=A0A9J7LCH6_BRAFL|nr:uncharacterized protein LOC118417855 [Branchiostoma floridae]